MDWVKKDSSFLMMNNALSGSCSLADQEPHCWDPAFLDRLVYGYMCSVCLQTIILQVLCQVPLPDDEDSEAATEPDQGPGGGRWPQCQSPPAGERPPGQSGEQETSGLVSRSSWLWGPGQTVSGPGVRLSRLSSIVHTVPWQISVSKVRFVHQSGMKTLFQGSSLRGLIDKSSPQNPTNISVFRLDIFQTRGSVSTDWESKIAKYIKNFQMEGKNDQKRGLKNTGIKTFQDQPWIKFTFSGQMWSCVKALGIQTPEGRWWSKDVWASGRLENLTLILFLMKPSDLQ